MSSHLILLYLVWSCALNFVSKRPGSGYTILDYRVPPHNIISELTERRNAIEKKWKWMLKVHVVDVIVKMFVTNHLLKDESCPLIWNFLEMFISDFRKEQSFYCLVVCLTRSWADQQWDEDVSWRKFSIHASNKRVWNVSM